MIALVVDDASGLVTNAIVVEHLADIQIAGATLHDAEGQPEGVWIGWRRSGRNWIAPSLPDETLSGDQAD